MSASELRTIRQQIDALDRELLALFNRRACLAQQVAEIKDSGESNRYYCPDREAEVLRNLVAVNSGPLPDDDVHRLFVEIMSACRALQQPMRVAFLGPKGTFTEAAVLKHFGHAVDTMALESIEAVFQEVGGRTCQYGVVPVENSTEGVVNHTLDMFLRSRLRICGEVELRIHHHLLVADGDVQSIGRIYSHQQSLAQCRRWLDLNVAGTERMTVSSNAEAARRASLEPGAAAIAGEAAAEVYGLKILAANIEDEPDNTTRFLIIGTESIPRTGDDKTSLLLSVINQPGALYTVLDRFARSDINITRIESRPSRNELWDYVFFVDIDGHTEDSVVANVLETIDRDGSLLKVLGSYPRTMRPTT